MAKRALLVGINKYLHLPNLVSSVEDATGMSDVLTRNDDGTQNYDCHLLTYPGRQQISREYLYEQCELLFKSSVDNLLFYFSGHGAPDKYNGSLMTVDESAGLSMSDLLDMANQSHAREVLLILDCSFSRVQDGQSIVTTHELSTEVLPQLREGTTILCAASLSELAQTAMHGQSKFTAMVIDALQGGAANVRGHVSAASIYAYVEQALGSWDQRPLYKSNASRLSPVRRCKPTVDDELLHLLSKYFSEPSSKYVIAPSYVRSYGSPIEAHVKIFQHFVKYRDARLLTTVGGKDLYFTAIESGAVELTLLGQLYWRMAKEGRL